MRLLLVTLVLAAAASTARADRDLCARGTVHRGPSVDLDVKDADVHDVLRLLADVGRVNLVVADDVSGRVTLRLVRVAWGQVACTVAAVHKLSITVQGEGVPGNRPILLVRKRVTSPAAPAAARRASRPADPR